MKAIVAIWVMSFACALAQGPHPWKYLEENVPNMGESPHFKVLDTLFWNDVKALYSENRKLAASFLPTIEPLAEKQSAGITEFQDRIIPEMDAAALAIWYEANACFKMGDYAEAKPLLEKVWKKYPYVRICYPTTWMPAADAYAEWRCIRWMEVMRSGDVSKYPFEPKLSLYHAVTEGARVSERMKGFSPIHFAVGELFKTDGPKPIEIAMEQMLHCTDFQNLDEGELFSLIVGTLAEPDIPAHASAQEQKNAWQQLQIRLDKWAQDEPESSLAKLVLVNFWTCYAWEARGSGVASTVTEDGWRLFEQRLQKALAVQREKFIPNPVWYSNALLLGTALNADTEQEIGVFEEGARKFPWAGMIYQQMLMYLLPRWHGSEGDWESFTRFEAQKVSPALYLDLTKMASNLGEKFQEEWPRIWKGYEARVKASRYPWVAANDYAKTACKKGDREAARRAFSLPECRFHPLYWGSREEYDWWKQWATQP